MKNSMLNASMFRSTTLFLIFLVITQASFGQKFVLPVLPDTQEEITTNPEMFYSQIKWIKESKDSLNIPIVLHVGDIVNFNNYDHWENANKGFMILDNANIPYALTLGNHDTYAVGLHSGSAAPGDVNANLRMTDKFNAYFPVYRLKAQRGRYEEGKSDNAYYTFKAGGANWLVLSLEFCARQGPVDWANEVISSHPTYNVIILTHFHLTVEGEINQTNAGYGDLTCQSIYDQMIKLHANILMVLSGHVTGSAWRVDKGVKGNNIYQILQDYQREDLGGGYIRLLEIDINAGTISAKMYSPYYNKTKPGSSQFRFENVSFTKVDY